MNKTWCENCKQYITVVDLEGKIILVNAEEELLYCSECGVNIYVSD